MIWLTDGVTSRKLSKGSPSEHSSVVDQEAAPRVLCAITVEGQSRSGENHPCCLIRHGGLNASWCIRALGDTAVAQAGSSTCVFPSRMACVAYRTAGRNGSLIRPEREGSTSQSQAAVRVHGIGHPSKSYTRVPSAFSRDHLVTALVSVANVGTVSFVTQGKL